MEQNLLHVISFTLSCEQDVHDALRHVRRLLVPACPSILLFADLAAGPAEQTPQDRPLIRMLQSGIMSIDAKTDTRVFLLVRRRTWSDVFRRFLGEEQPLTCRDVIAQLLAHGKTEATFEAATLAPAALEQRYDAVLFSSLSIACTPDTPLRMHDALSQTHGDMLAASILHPRIYPQSTLARAALCAPLTLCPLEAARSLALHQRAFAPASAPAIYTANALEDHLLLPASALPLAQGCIFIRRHPISLRELFSSHRRACMQGKTTALFMPPAQLLLFFLCAATGFPLLAAFAFLPEFWALVHPRQWPGVLLRTALLPITASLSLDALACRLFARASLFRLRVPAVFFASQGSMLLGAALLPLAITSAHALTVLLPIVMLWLFAPVILPALESPTLERIPLPESGRAQLHLLAQGAYDDAQRCACSTSLRMLVFLAGRMLGILETDEAARRIQALIDGDIQSHADCAARLVCAQYLREHMDECDAALRSLPAQLEAAASAAAAKIGNALPMPADILFLPLEPAKSMPIHPMTLPLTHPHTFLHQYQQNAGVLAESDDPTVFFLSLAAAALSHPFHALLTRSPVAAPYMLLLSI